MSVEKIDILVLTETHSLELTPPRSTLVLAQTGTRAASGGVAILARNDGSWLSSDTTTLIPGHAIITKITHRKSTEAFWVLGVYADISDSLTSLLTFYETLRFRILDHVSDLQTKG